MAAAADLALPESGEIVLNWETPIAAIVKAKKTYKTYISFHFQEGNMHCWQLEIHFFCHNMLMMEKLFCTRKTSENDVSPAATSLAPA